MKGSEKQRRKGKIYHLNAEFQRIARRDNKAFLNDQCKEMEENNRIGKTRNLFKKIRGTKGTFHAKMGSIKDRNGRRGGMNTQKNCTKKILMTQIITNYVITHLEPNILECELKWAFGSITTNKASGGDEIPVE